MKLEYEKYLVAKESWLEESSKNSTLALVRRVQSKLSQAKDIEDIALTGGILGILVCSLVTKNEGRKNKLNSIAGSLLSI